MDQTIDLQPVTTPALMPSLRPFWSRLLQCHGYDIRPARARDQQDILNMLIRRTYAWRGFNNEPIDHCLDDPDRLTLAAWQFDEVVATISLGRDSPAGLPTEKLFSREIARLRRPGRVLCEISNLAVDRDFSSPDLLVNLFQTALRYARNSFSATDLLIEVGASHVYFYQRRMGFRQMSVLRQHRYNEMPVILMHQKLDAIEIASAA